MKLNGTLVAFFLAFAVAAACAVQHSLLNLKLAFAEGQVSVFHQMVKEAGVLKDPHSVTTKLRYVVWHYPSGSKQAVGTRLDRIVETSRSNSVNAIVAHLRATTGRDLGDEAEAWLRAYPEQ